jgi:hypothetical protein
MTGVHIMAGGDRRQIRCWGSERDPTGNCRELAAAKSIQQDYVP